MFQYNPDLFKNTVYYYDFLVGFWDRPKIARKYQNLKIPARSLKEAIERKFCQGANTFEAKRTPFYLMNTVCEVHKYELVRTKGKTVFTFRLMEVKNFDDVVKEIKWKDTR